MMAQTQGSPALQQLSRARPLQRFKSPSLGISALVHIVGLASFANSYRYLVTHPNPINTSYGWHFQYLTIIGLSLSTLTFLTALFADIASPSRLSTRLSRIKSLLSTSSLPLSSLISTLYWGLRLIDPALVVPPDLELPLSDDLGFHAYPTLLLLTDLLLLSPPWTITFGPAALLSGSIAFGYWFWIELCYSKNGFYPYPLFDLLNYPQRVALFVGSAMAMAGMTGVLRWLYRVVNGVDAQKAER